ncbi:hypothetical protein [Sinorhizobium psoraleae]|uniref:hypothetical protein n=1 Tax=Sinorhizobium psoraleae TaxID=520838 RepID=UPI0022AEC440|nr:hypothetical protein [Sinorhizobium psoraleae]
MHLLAQVSQSIFDRPLRSTKQQIANLIDRRLGMHCRFRPIGGGTPPAPFPTCSLPLMAIPQLLTLLKPVAIEIKQLEDIQQLIMGDQS